MVDWPAGKAATVEALLPKARESLVTVAEDVPLVKVAKLFQAGADLLVVCNSAGLLAGVITKSDMVAQISHCLGAICKTAAALVMTQDVVFCQPKDLLQDVWTRMKAQKLKHIPVVDDQSRPIGLLHARDILQILLSNSESEDDMLRDYVMGVGYR